MTNYNFTDSINRENTGAFKTNKAIVKGFLGLPYYEDSISMWVADMDFATAPEIIERLKQRADKLIFGYTGATKEYNDSIISWYKKRYDVDIAASSIVISNGTVLAIRNSIRAFTAPGDKIIIQSPVYFPFSSEIKSTGREILDNQLLKDKDNNYPIDFEDFEKKCKEATMFIFCNPHNPTGDIWKKEDVERLLKIAKENDVLVFSDEVHSDLIRKTSKFTSALALENNENVVVATAINKTFNLAGLHGTNLIIKNKELREKLSAFTGMVSISPFTMEATIAAYSQSEAWLDELRDVLDENFKFMEEFIKEKMPRVKFHTPEGTYLAWLDFSAYNMSDDELVKRFATDAHVILEGGSMFGKMAQGFIRMNVACPKSTLKEALERMYMLLEKGKTMKAPQNALTFQVASSDCSCSCSSNDKC